MGKKHYNTLGVPETASQDDIKKAFKKLAVTHHPDKGGDEQRFKEINEANNILSDPQKRRVYDVQGDGGCNRGTSAPGNPPNMHPFPFGFGGQFGFTNVFFNGGTQNAQPKSKVYNKTVSISLEEAYKGCKKEVELQCHGLMCPECVKVCNVCGGHGSIDETVRRTMGGTTVVQTMRKACGECGGKGKKLKNASANDKSVCAACGNSRQINKSSKVTLEIPAGVPDNFTTKVKHPIDQDSILTIKVEIRNTIPGYVRKGDDLEYTLKVSLLDALLGKRFEIPHPSGQHVEIDYTCNNDIVRPNSTTTLQGKGMKGNTKLIVKFEVEFPKTRRAQAPHDPETTSDCSFKKMREIYGELFDT